MKKAFTLLELLVSVVVIGIILALLFPALGRVREAARRAQCMNNLRQHGIAWYLYLDDHDECFPTVGLPSMGGATNMTFGGKQGSKYGIAYGAQYRVLNSYLDIDSDADKRALEIFHCPDDIKGTFGNPPQTTFDFYGTSYYCNNSILLWGSIGNWRPRPLRTITSQRNKVHLEMCYYNKTPGHGGKGVVSPKTPVMVLFVDCHVAGPFLYSLDFEPYLPNTDKPVITDPNGTWGMYD